MYGMVGNRLVDTFDSYGLTDYLIGFNGKKIGSSEPYGNEWAIEIFDSSGGDKKWWFQQGENEKAIDKLFPEIDTDNDKYLSGDEIGKHTYRLFGYSWGGPTALAMSVQLNNPPKTHHDKGGGRNVQSEYVRFKSLLGYTFCRPFPIKALVTIDPIFIGKGSPSAKEYTENDNVQSQESWFQSNSRSNINVPLWTMVQNPGNNQMQKMFFKTPATFGNFWSSKFHGKPVQGNAKPVNVNVNVDLANSQVSRAFFRSNPSVMMTLKGVDVNHDTITWFLFADAIKALK